MKKIILWIFLFLWGLLFLWNISFGENCVKLNTDFPWVWDCIDPEKGTDVFWDMLWAVMKLAVNFTIAVSFIAIIAAGIMIATSWVSQSTAWKWKELLKKVILWIVLLWLSWLILHVINPNFFKTNISYQLIQKINP